jgi:recombinational DNA repair protein (RecF pathway)
MNIFKSKGYILRKIKQGNKEHIYLVFSYDYGKISCLKKNSSKEKELDV